MTACSRDGESFADSRSKAAHSLALDLQDMLIGGARGGAVLLPGVGEIEWATMIAAADMLIGMVWQDVTNRQRQRLFDRIARDAALPPGDRAALWAATNYGGLLILGWLFGDLHHRLPAAMAILRAPRFDRMLARLPDVDDALAKALRITLAPAMPKSPTTREGWRAWLNAIPETAKDLRQRAAHERHRYRRQRLAAFADLKDGATVTATAVAVDVMPKSLHVWLKRGAKDGLEAALERPAGRPALTSGQAEALAEWFAADCNHQHHQALIDRAADRFGIVLSTSAAVTLLRAWSRSAGTMPLAPETKSMANGSRNTRSRAGARFVN